MILPAISTAILALIPASNPAFNYYGRWDCRSTATSVNSGSLVEFAYTGDRCLLVFNVKDFTVFPGIFVQADNGTVVRTTLSASSTSVRVDPAYNSIPKGLPPYPVPSSRWHFVRFWIAVHSTYHTPAEGTQWTSLDGACRFQGVELAPGGKLVGLPYIRNQIEFLGDSITQGLRILYTGADDDVGEQVPYANWPQLTADLLGLKPVVTGFGGLAMAGPGTSGVPRASDSFPFVYSGVKWAPPVEPKAVVIYQGTNGDVSAEVFRALYRDYLELIRQTYPSAIVFAVCPHNRGARYAAAIREAAEGMADSGIIFLDYSSGVISPTEMCDHIGHLNPGGAGRLGSKLAGDIAAVLGPMTAGRPTLEPPQPKPTVPNAAYGPDRHQRLDFWEAASIQPTPLVLIIHGGGWNRGDKTSMDELEDLTRYLRAGISVASINYRFTWQAYAAGVNPPVAWPMHDGARALQFLRSKSREWNIDRRRIALTGDSAGACMSLWLAFHQDLADPASRDPVGRESTRPCYAAVLGAQTSLDPKEMRQWTPNSHYGNQAFGVFKGGLPREQGTYGVFLERQNDSSNGDFEAFLAARDRILPLIREYSPYDLASAGAPPVHLYYVAPPAMGQVQDDPTHTANFGVALAAKLRRDGDEVELTYPGAAGGTHADIADELIAKLTSRASSEGRETGSPR